MESVSESLNVLKAVDILHVLRDRIVLLPGSRDRNDRSIIFVPAKEYSSQINSDHLRNLLLYLYEVSADDSKKRGFVFVFDMRKGTTWNDIKPILKTLQDYFPGLVSTVFIIKPENFWEKHKTSVSSGKYKFDIQLISVEALGKYIDLNQILPDFGGTMCYNHDEWLDLRLEIEKLVTEMSELIATFLKCGEKMQDAEIPINVSTAKAAINRHTELQQNLLMSIIKEREKELKRIEEKITKTSNPDLVFILPHINQLFKTLARTRTEVFCQWEIKKQELDQLCQLKLFQQDSENLIQWIRHQYDQIFSKFTYTGNDEAEIKVLLKENGGFNCSIDNAVVRYNKIIDDGKRLKVCSVTNGKENDGKIVEMFLSQLEKKWQELLQLVDQRKRLLHLSLNVYQKCNTFLQHYETWIENVGVDPSLIINKTNEEMQEALNQHEIFGKTFETEYSEAFASSTQLSKLMKKLFEEKSVSQAHSYIQLIKLIQQIAHAKRQLHSIWKSRHETIHYRLSNAIFFSDMRSVIDWLEQHGEPFLRRKIAIGHDRASANSLNQNHANFRLVAMNTHNNAVQLFAMAQELKNSGEVNEEEITQAVTELRRKIDTFRKKVDLRTNLLFIASNFFLHYDEIMAWYDHMNLRLETLAIIPESVEECEQNKEKLQAENDGTMQAFARVMSEAQQLQNTLKQQRIVLNVDNSDAIRHVENLVAKIENRHIIEKDRWPEQRVYLNAAAKVAIFLRDYKDIRKQLLSWREDLKGLKHSVSNKAEVIMHYHRQNTESVRTVISDALNQMGEIIQLIQNKNLHLIIANTDQSAEEAISIAATELQELERKVMEIASEVTDRIELSLKVNEIISRANEITNAIEEHRNRLQQMYYIPENLTETEHELDVHQRFKHDCENVEKMLKDFEKKVQQNIDYISIDSSRYQMILTVLEQVKAKYSQLVGLLEHRTKLLNFCLSYYKYVKDIFTVSESIERDLKGDQSDFCLKLFNNLSTNSIIRYDVLKDVFETIVENINTYTSRKVKFLEISLHAQKTSDNLLRYIRRCHGAPAVHISKREQQILAFKNRIQESKIRILELWFQRKTRFDHCHKIVLLQISAYQISEEIKKKCDNYKTMFIKIESLKTMSNSIHYKSANLQLTIDELFKSCEELKLTVKEERNKVSSLIQHLKRIEQRCTDDDFHCELIKQADQIIRVEFQQIYDLKINVENLIKSIVNDFENHNIKQPNYSNNDKSVSNSYSSSREALSSLDRFSDSSIEQNIQKENDISLCPENFNLNMMAIEKKKTMEPMKELIESEKHYIDHLSLCIDKYLIEYRIAGNSCPQVLKQKEYKIFGNIEQLYKFHSEIFLIELLAYERHPEDVGYCFIQWMERLKELYAEYCLNKEENNNLIALPESIAFFSAIRERNNLDHCYSLESLVIKPVQRITRYQLMLKQLIKCCAMGKKEMQDAIDAVMNIPKLANDKMHLKNFEFYKEYCVGDFIMQDTFLVSEPKKYFKREREMQVFLFESNIIFTKREDIGSKKIRYTYKDSMLLCEIHVVEHVEGDNTKFGLRKESHLHQNDLTTVLKTTTELNRMFWVKTLRNLKLDLKLESKKSNSTDPNNSALSVSNRNSQISRESYLLSNGLTNSSEDRFSMNSTCSASIGIENSLIVTSSPKNPELVMITLNKL